MLGIKQDRTMAVRNQNVVYIFYLSFTLPFHFFLSSRRPLHLRLLPFLLLWVRPLPSAVSPTSSTSITCTPKDAQILWPHQRSFHPDSGPSSCSSVRQTTYAYFYRVWIWVGRYDKGGSAFVLLSISAAAASTLSSSQFTTSSYFGFWSIIPDPGPGRCQLRCR